MADAAEATATASDDPITCHIDNAKCHSIKVHIERNHPSWTVDRYKAEFPGAPLLSNLAKRRLAERRAMKADTAAEASEVKQRVFHEAFGLPKNKATLNKQGAPINITVFDDVSQAMVPYKADIDGDYVFDIDLTKKVIIGMQTARSVYLWGYHGTGKTSLLKQVCARTGRPFMRVQHTIGTEESHIVGQYVVRTKVVDEEIATPDGPKTVQREIAVTEFQLGPLPLAMIEGGVYCADEYDFAMPSVIAVYQSVLEGEPLVIKDAPPEFRVIRPHPEFRFVATGNTNGVGDETGLYQGTMIQNAANYSRFGIVEEVKYLSPDIEQSILMSKTRIAKPQAEKFVQLANKIREEFMAGKISGTLSPRELINSADLGVLMGGEWINGLKLGFFNRMTRVDKLTCENLAQRIFG